MDGLYLFLQRPIVWIFTLFFILFYPMLISIYVFLPLLIGLMGYMLIDGIEKGKIKYVLVASFYFINLEANLSLPFFLTLISVLLVYVLFFPYLKHFRRCLMCSRLITVLLLDGVYLGMLLSYDFLFQKTSVILDLLLVYSFIVDLLVVSLL
ncbi:MAG: hypothetical protein IE885_01805 [Campylobacterales bacterium]|nr:hypothetical protein [Campylobacterales bacterium]